MKQGMVARSRLEAGPYLGNRNIKLLYKCDTGNNKSNCQKKKKKKTEHAANGGLKSVKSKQHKTSKN
jgi:hypothetical protein